MHILLIYGEGRTEEALLLSAAADRMRILRRGQADAVEFRRFEGLWMSESGGTVEVGAVLPEARSRLEEEFDRVAAGRGVGYAVDRFGNLMAN